MRTVEIDLANLEDEYECGQCGERKATELRIDVSSMMDALFLVVVFKNGLAETYCSERYYIEEITAGVINIKLWRDLTRTVSETAVVEAYNENDNGELVFLTKSPKICLHFDSSISSDQAFLDDETEGLYKELQKLEKEFNNNLDILDKEIEKCETATSNADNATTAANNAATEAVEAKNNAEIATKNAIDAAANANTAAMLAIKKADDADTAAQNANAAAEYASEKASKAEASAIQAANSANAALDSAFESATSAASAWEAASAAQKIAEAALSKSTASEELVKETVDSLNSKIANGEFNGKDGADYILTEEDKLEIANIAVENASKAAENANDAADKANDLIDDITERLENGEFKGEKGDRGEQGPQGEKGNDGISPTVSVEEIDGGNCVTFTDTNGKKSFDILNGKDGANGEGGTVTYKIPKEYYETEFADDPNTNPRTNSITITFGKFTLDSMQIEEDIESGVIEMPEDYNEWGENEQDEFMFELVKKYISLDIKPWVPTPRVSWFDLIYTSILEKIGIFANGTGRYTSYLNKIWNNDFKVSIYAENANGEIAYNCIKSDVFVSTNELTFGMIPTVSAVEEYDEETEISTITLYLMGTGESASYSNLTIQNNVYVTNDDIKEVTITFIPNNAYVEEYDDEHTE